MKTTVISSKSVLYKVVYKGQARYFTTYPAASLFSLDHCPMNKIEKC